MKQTFSLAFLIRITAIPMIILVVLIGLIYFVAYKIEKQTSEEEAIHSINDLISSDETFLTNEIYLAKHAAVRERFRLISKATLQRYPTARLCFSVPDVTEYSFKGFSNCDFENLSSRKIVFHKLKVGDSTLVSVSFHIENVVGDLEIPTSLWISFLLALLIAIPLNILLAISFKRKVVVPLLKRIEEESQKAALAKMTQIVAHDVRAPFQTLNFGLDILSEINDPEEFTKEVKKLRMHIKSSMARVNGMLYDILNFGDGTSIYPTNVSARKILLDSLQNCFRNNSIDVKLTFDIQLTYKLRVDEAKVCRVFENLINNAIPFMKIGSRMWFRLRQNQGFAIITIGNSDSFLPEENLQKIFDSFFSSEKPGGTGLGLAIVKQMIEAHKGQIDCKSDREKGTEFVLSLPLSSEADDTTIKMPRSSLELNQ